MPKCKICGTNTEKTYCNKCEADIIADKSHTFEHDAFEISSKWVGLLQIPNHPVHSIRRFGCIDRQ